MSNVVFVLGAGCSKDCGAPLMADFLDVAWKIHITGKAREQAEHFNTVFKAIGALQAVHSKSHLDIINVESVFNAFEMANTIGRLPGFPADKIPGVIKSLKQVIVTTLEQTMDFPVQGSTIGTPHPYEAFSELILHLTLNATPVRTVSVITFNYDVAVDVALFRARLGTDYALVANTGTNAIPLLKLHGSLNWALNLKDGSVVPLPLSDYLARYSLRSWSDVRQCHVPIGSQLQEYFSKNDKIQVSPEPVIVPPTWNKADYYQLISPVWARAAKELSEAEHIFIIGYSLAQTDAFFRLLYGLGSVGDLPLSKIEVFNPDGREETIGRFKDLMGPGALARFKYVTQPFGFAIGQIRNYFPGRQ